MIAGGAVTSAAGARRKINWRSCVKSRLKSGGGFNRG
jgi:hypothetical protein